MVNVNDIYERAFGAPFEDSSKMNIMQKQQPEGERKKKLVEM